VRAGLSLTSNLADRALRVPPLPHRLWRIPASPMRRQSPHAGARRPRERQGFGPSDAGSQRYAAHPSPRRHGGTLARTPTPSGCRRLRFLLKRARPTRSRRVRRVRGAGHRPRQWQAGRPTPSLTASPDPGR